MALHHSQTAAKWSLDTIFDTIMEWTLYTYIMNLDLFPQGKSLNSIGFHLELHTDLTLE